MTAIAKVMKQPVGALKGWQRKARSRAMWFCRLNYIEKNGASRLEDVLDTAQKLVLLNTRLDDLRVAPVTSACRPLLAVSRLSQESNGTTKLSFTQSVAQIKSDLDSISSIIPSWASTVAKNTLLFEPLSPLSLCLRRLMAF